MAQSSTTPRITGVGTVGIPVTDQGRALAFYGGTLGFETRLDAEFRPGLRWIEVAPAGASTSLALLPVTPDVPVGVDTHIRLSTDDAAADHAALAGAGVEVGEFLSEPVPMFWFHDPDGNTLYLVQRPGA
jgi:catechol 2,3-dioxygenase-like lactoylglutathione lyase family enzyme